MKCQAVCSVLKQVQHPLSRSELAHSQVNGQMQTSNPDVYAIGDVAAFPLKNYGVNKTMRQEHVANCRQSAKHAVASIMDSSTGDYDYLPFFYSRIFDLGWQVQVLSGKPYYFCMPVSWGLVFFCLINKVHIHGLQLPVFMGTLPACPFPNSASVTWAGRCGPKPQPLALVLLLSLGGASSTLDEQAGILIIGLFD